MCVCGACDDRCVEVGILYVHVDVIVSATAPMVCCALSASLGHSARRPNLLEPQGREWTTMLATSNWVLDRLPPTFAAPADVPPEWAHYLRGVYGEGVLAEAAFPLSMARFEVFYSRLLPHPEQRIVRARPLLGLANSSNASSMKPADALLRVPTGSRYWKRLRRR